MELLLQMCERNKDPMSDAPKADSRQQRIRVLLAEDNSRDAEFVQWLLARCEFARFDVTRAAGLSSALPIAQSRRCDLVLLDLALPDALGLPSLREFALAAPSIPIIVLTGLDEESTVLQAISQGAQDYFVKGRDNMGLLSRSIRFAIERKAFEERRVRQSHQT